MYFFLTCRGSRQQKRQWKKVGDVEDVQSVKKTKKTCESQCSCDTHSPSHTRAISYKQTHPKEPRILESHMEIKMDRLYSI